MYQMPNIAVYGEPTCVYFVANQFRSIANQHSSILIQFSTWAV